MSVCDRGNDMGFRGRVTHTSLEECMTAVFCHCMDERSITAGEEDEEKEGERHELKGRGKKKNMLFFFFNMCLVRKLGHPK